jgi:hypothetical protein
MRAHWEEMLEYSTAAAANEALSKKERQHWAEEADRFQKLLDEGEGVDSFRTRVELAARVELAERHGVDDATWRELIRMGNELLKGKVTFKERDYLKEKIAWAESKVEPLGRDRESFMEAWQLPETVEGYKEAMDRLLHMINQGVFSANDEKAQEHAKQGWMISFVMDEYEKKPSLRAAYKIIEKHWNEREGWAKDQFRTINKPLKQVIKTPAKIDEHGNVLIPVKTKDIYVERWPHWEEFKRKHNI